MPKKTKRRGTKPTAPKQQPNSALKVSAWVRWVAIGIVFGLLVSLIAGAMTATPASAATSTSCLLDNDQDGIANPDDSDVDGDGIINGEDDDIDGDGVVNAQDGDPLDTNCIDSEPPLLGYANTGGEQPFDWKPIVTFGFLGSALAAVAITLVVRQRRK